MREEDRNGNEFLEKESDERGKETERWEEEEVSLEEIRLQGRRGCDEEKEGECEVFPLFFFKI